MGTNWIIEGTIDPKWPHNTRGNIGEVFPEVLTSIGYHLGVVVAEQAWRAAYDELGILKRGDFDRDDPVIIGLYAGYAYLNLSYLRMMGVRAPGSSAEAIDVAFFGEGDPPPYEPRKGDKSLGSSLKILRSELRALGEKGLPEVAVDSYRAVEEAEAVKPSLDATDEELFAYLHDFPTGFRRVFGNHMITTALAAIVSGILADAAAAAGQPGLVTHLIGAAGDVHSARYSQDLYEIAKTVRDTPALLRAFDDGVEGLLSRIDSEPAAETFRTQFAGFVAEHGHRGPNDWEFSARTWDSDPELALAAIDAMRKTDRDLSPAARLGDDDEKRQAAIAVVRPHVGRLDRMNFDKAIKAIPFWQQGREATRDRAIRFMLPYKQVFRELVRRAAENGGDPDPVHVGLLHPFDELPGHVADPSAFADAVATSAALFAALGADEAKRVLDALKANAVVCAGNADVKDRVAQGELPVGLTDTDDANLALLAGAPVAVVFPDQEADAAGTLLIPKSLRRLVGRLLRMTRQAKNGVRRTGIQGTQVMPPLRIWDGVFQFLKPCKRS